jgi:hypothetical protein
MIGKLFEPEAKVAGDPVHGETFKPVTMTSTKTSPASGPPISIASMFRISR